MSASPERPPSTNSEEVSFSPMSQPDSESIQVAETRADDTSKCLHFKAILTEDTSSNILAKYKAVVSWNVNRRQDVLHPAKRRRASILQIFARVVLILRHRYPRLHVILANSLSRGRLRACIARSRDAGPLAISLHIRKRKVTDSVSILINISTFAWRLTRDSLSGVDVKSGSIFCSECDDFIYDAAVDNLNLLTVVSAEEKQTRFQGELDSAGSTCWLTGFVKVAKNGREPFRSWVPSAKDVAALEGAVALPCQGEIF